MDQKRNIAIAGGPCTGKSTLAASLFARLKYIGLDYDLITEESRKLKQEFVVFRSPFERFYMWRQQEREELRSSALNGFITDTPLFHFYVSARMHVKETRDLLAIRELFRMCLELEDRYQLIVIAGEDIIYRKDQARSSEELEARSRHKLICSFLDHFWPDKLLYVSGSLEERLKTIETNLKV